jgi:hypothetical protein
LFFESDNRISPYPEVWGGDKGSRGLALKSHRTLYLADGAVLLGGVRVYIQGC